MNCPGSRVFAVSEELGVGAGLLGSACCDALGGAIDDSVWAKSRSDDSPSARVGFRTPRPFCRAVPKLTKSLALCLGRNKQSKSLQLVISHHTQYHCCGLSCANRTCYVNTSAQ